MTEGKGFSVDWLAIDALDRFARSGVSYPRFVQQLEHAVDAAVENGDPRAARLRSLWGQLEIINALTGGSMTPEQRTDVSELVRQIRDTVT